MKNFLIYIFIVVMTIYIEIMYDDSGALVFLAFEILLLLILTGVAWYLKGHVQIVLESYIPVVQKGEEMEVSIRIRNSGVIPITRLILWLSYENEYSPAQGTEPFEVCVAAKGETTITYLAKAKYCGRVNFFLSKGKIFDPLGLFGKRIKSEAEIQLNVLPDIYEVPLMVGDKGQNYIAEAEEYKLDRAGDDPSEIFDIREFREGDTLQRVHWKLSAKADQLMTKEFGSQMNCGVLLLLDLYQHTSTGVGIERMDAFMEIASSLLFSICRAGVFFAAAWYDEEKRIVERYFVKSEEDVYVVIDRILSSPCYMREYNLYEGYETEYPNSRYDTILKLDTNLVLQKDRRQMIAYTEMELVKQIESKTVEL